MCSLTGKIGYNAPARCSGKFVAPENYSHTQRYELGLRLRIGLNLRLELGLGVGLRLGLGLWLGLRLGLGLGLGLALVRLWQYGGGKNFPGVTNFPRHRHHTTNKFAVPSCVLALKSPGQSCNFFGRVQLKISDDRRNYATLCVPRILFLLLIFLYKKPRWEIFSRKFCICRRKVYRRRKYLPTG